MLPCIRHRRSNIFWPSDSIFSLVSSRFKCANTFLHVSYQSRREEWNENGPISRDLLVLPVWPACFSNSTVKTGHGHSFMKWDEMNWDSHQRTLTYFVRGNITVWLTSCLTGLDSAVLLNWNNKQTCLFGQILTGQTGGQAYSDISPYKVSECSLQSSTKIVRPPVPAIHMLHNLLITACHLGRCIPASLSAKEVCYSVNNHQSDKSSSTMTSVTRLLNLLDFGQLFKALGNN